MASGTEGYDRFTSLFITSSQSLEFSVVCKDFMPFLPDIGASVLDLGAGAGQNAAALAELGYKVTALEPMKAFLSAAKEAYQKHDIEWLHDSLPHIKTITSRVNTFDFVLLDGVWHHLSESEREIAVKNIASVMKNNGRCALSLRNGPPGMGTRIFPIDVDRTISLFESYGFNCLLELRQQPSILPNKEHVKWARLVLEKVV